MCLSATVPVCGYYWVYKVTLRLLLFLMSVIFIKLVILVAIEDQPLSKEKVKHSLLRFEPNAYLQLVSWCSTQ